MFIFLTNFFDENYIKATIVIIKLPVKCAGFDPQKTQLRVDKPSWEVELVSHRMSNCLKSSF